jgi:hypothetical protein|tara:strand:+ start:34 stop:150 length:117 start_codon:yes stop_codon:yes gene_type:complete
MKKLLVMLVVAVLATGCLYAAKEADEEYEKTEDSKSSQ